MWPGFRNTNPSRREHFAQLPGEEGIRGDRDGEHDQLGTPNGLRQVVGDYGKLNKPLACGALPLQPSSLDERS